MPPPKDDRERGDAGWRWPLVAGVLVLAGLATLIALSPHRLVYDERYYMQASWLLRERFDFAELMRTPLDIAAGPLYPYLHLLFEPLTGLFPPAVRFVNWVSLAVALWAIAATLRGFGDADPWARAALLLAVPMIGPTSGLALTEIPALACAALACAAVAGVDGDRRGRAIVLFIAAGVLAGLAVTGRQTYLPGLVGFALMGIANRRLLVPALLATAAALLTIAPMVIAWGGLVPPWQASMVTGIVPAHGVVAFAYLAIATLLIAPAFFAAPWTEPRVRAPAFAVVVAVVSIALLAGFRFSVAYTLVARFPPILQPAIQVGLNAALLAAAVMWFAAVAVNGWIRRGDGRFVLLALLTGLLNGTALGIGHQFSSRYVLAAFPFALLMLQPWIRPNRWAAARIALGAALGWVSLVLYYSGSSAPDPNVRSVAPPSLVEKMPLGQGRLAESKRP